MKYECDKFMDHFSSRIWGLVTGFVFLFFFFLVFCPVLYAGRLWKALLE